MTRERKVPCNRVHMEGILLGERERKRGEEEGETGL